MNDVPKVVRNFLPGQGSAPIYACIPRVPSGTRVPISATPSSAHEKNWPSRPRRLVYRVVTVTRMTGDENH